MFLVDFNQTMIANLMAQLDTKKDMEIDLDIFRHMCLNTLRSYNKKYKPEYKEMIIACDNGTSWRKKIFPYYKANRKKITDESCLNWDAIFVIMEQLRQDLHDYFPYRVINVKLAEADDVIGTLVQEYLEESFLILSADHDFIQLQMFGPVKQYDPINKRWLFDTNPEQYLFEHILMGDKGDGIPNILSDDDCIVSKTRQRSMTKKRIQAFSDTPWLLQETVAKRNFARNKMLIDLRETPKEIKKEIVKQYEEQKGKDRRKLFQYFCSRGLSDLAENINDF
jgi:5'-3' exonuclease